MDVWLLSSMGFVAGALLEYAVLLWLRYDSKVKDEKEAARGCRRLDTWALIAFLLATFVFIIAYSSYVKQL